MINPAWLMGDLRWLVPAKIFPPLILCRRSLKCKYGAESFNQFPLPPPSKFFFLLRRAELIVIQEGADIFGRLLGKWIMAEQIE